MVNDTTVIEAKIVATVDPGSFRDGIKFAKDTGKAIDQELRTKLRLDTLAAEDKIKEIQKLLKTDLPTERRTKLRLDLTDAKRNLTETKRELNNLANTGDKTTSRLQAKFNATNSEIKKSNSLIGRLKSGLKGVGAAIVAAFSIRAVGNFLKESFNLASQIQSSEAALTSLTGSLDSANVLLGKIDEFAARTPFNKLGIIDASKQLLGFNFAAEDIIPTLEGVGNAVAAVGGNQETFNGVVSALGKIQATGKLSLESINQIAERGIPIFQILQDELGLTAEQVGNIGAQGVTAAEAIPAILAGIQGKFGDALEAQSKTLSGQLSNLVDSAQLLLSKIGAALIPVFTGLLSIGSSLVGFFSKFGASIAKATAVVVPLTIAFFAYTGTLWGATAATSAFATAMAFLTGPVGIAIASIGVLTAAFAIFGGSSEQTIESMRGVSVQAGKLADKIDILEKSAKALKDQYKAGAITAVEYANKQAEIEREVAKATVALIKQAEAAKILNKRYNEAQDELTPLNKKLDEQNERYISRSNTISSATEKGKENGAGIIALKQKLSVLGGEIGETVSQIENLEAVEKVQIATQEDVQAALDKVSTAAARGEFQALQKEALDTISAFVSTQKALLALESQTGGLISTKSLALQNSINKAQGEFFKLQSQIFGGDSLGADDDSGGGGGGGGRKSKAKEETEDLQKEIEDQAALRIKQSQLATDNAEKLAKDLVQINKSKLDQLLAAEGTTDDEILNAKLELVKAQRGLDQIQLKNAEDAAEELTNAQQKALDKQVEGFELAFDAIGDAIKSKEDAIADFTKQIEDSGKTIDDLTDKMQDVRKETAGDLAGRFIEVTDQLSGGGISGAERAKLEEELALLKENTSEQERIEAIRKDGLSETEKILEVKNLELIKLAELKNAEIERFVLLDEARTAESFQLAELRSLEEELSNRAIEQVQKEFGEKTKAAKEFESVLDSIIAKQALAAQSAGGFQAASIFTGTQTVPIDQSSTTVNVGGVTVPEGVQDIATIGDIILEAIKDAQKQQA